jgi:hypothetical protein
MKNVTELRIELCNVFTGLRDGTTEPKVASEMNNSAGKIINTVKVQLEAAAMSGTKPNIPFLK